MKLYRLVTGLLLVSLIASGCGLLAAPTPEREPLKVGWVLWGGWYPIVIAEQQGLFEKHGVQVEPVFYEIYSNIPKDFAANKMDGGLFALFDVLPLESRQPGQILDKVVMVTDDSQGADAVLGGAGVNSVADLKGKRIGVLIGSYAEVMIARMLELNQLTNTDVQFVSVQPENALQALASGQVDAVHSYEPYVSQALAEGYKTIFTSANTPGLIPNVLAFRADVVRERPEDIRAFIAAWFEAQSYWLANPEEGNRLIAEATQQKPEDISLAGIQIRTLSDNQTTFEARGESTSIYFSAQYNLNFLVSSGSVSAAPDINELLDPSFLK